MILIISNVFAESQVIIVFLTPLFKVLFLNIGFNPIFWLGTSI